MSSERNNQNDTPSNFGFFGIPGGQPEIPRPQVITGKNRKEIVLRNILQNVNINTPDSLAIAIAILKSLKEPIPDELQRLYEKKLDPRTVMDSVLYKEAEHLKVQAVKILEDMINSV